MKKSILYILLYPIVRLFYPNIKTVYEEAPSEEPGIFVCNHAGPQGPIMMTVNFKRKHSSWILSYAIDKKHTENYAYHDIFIGDARIHKGIYHFLSKNVKWFLPPILKSVDFIPVYHDHNVMETFKQSLNTLDSGKDVVIFAESPKKYSPYINELQNGFISIASMYYRETGKCLKFYPTYVCKKRKRIMVGSPITFDPNIPLNEQKDTICKYICESITRLGSSLKKHKPVPFLQDKWYEAYGQYEDDFASYWKMVESGTFKR